MESKEKVVYVDNHQIRSPTFVNNTAKIAGKIVSKKLRGIFHYSDQLKMTKYEMAIKVAKLLEVENGNIKAKKIDQESERPYDCSLNIGNLIKNEIMEKVNFDQHIQTAWK